MQLRALVEVWPSETLVYIQELPGALASGATTEEALAALADAVEAHLGWLAGNGFAFDAAEAIGIEVVEQMIAGDGVGPLFALDRETLYDARLNLALRIGALARRDLIDVYRSMSAVRRERVVDGGGWSVAAHLRHVAELDLAYTAPLARVGVEPVVLPGDPVAALQVSGRIAAERLEAVPPEARGTVFQTDSGEQWTASKAVRRMTAHLREHLHWVLALARG